MNRVLFHIRFTLGAIAAVLFFSGCQEKIDCVYRDKRLCDPNYSNNVTTGIIPFDEDLTDYSEKFLLEEFTGFLCTNCPTATATAKTLRNTYPGRLTIVAVHCTPFFASPLTDDPNEPFYLDFRTVEGEEYYNFFQPPGLPDGVINRLGTENTSTIAFQSWAGRLEVVMPQNDPEVFIKISEILFETDSTSVTARIIVKPLINSEDNYNINFGIMESGIEEAQKDVGNTTLYDYVHDHVFRGNSNGTWGTPAYSGDIELAANEAIGFKLTMDVSPDWNLNNCEAFVYITKESNREVVQVEERPLIE
jgi:hypothetical protein